MYIVRKGHRKYDGVPVVNEGHIVRMCNKNEIRLKVVDTIKTHKYFYKYLKMIRTTWFTPKLFILVALYDKNNNCIAVSPVLYFKNEIDEMLSTLEFANEGIRNSAGVRNEAGAELLHADDVEAQLEPSVEEIETQ